MKTTVSVAIGERIHKARKAAGFKQLELANRLNISRATICNLESGENCTSIDKLYLIADELNVSIRDLLPMNINAPAETLTIIPYEPPKRMKLYRVRLRGMNNDPTHQTCYGTSYVVAENPDEAYKKVRAFLDEKKIGYDWAREMDTIELLADTYQYSGCGIILYV